MDMKQDILKRDQRAAQEAALVPPVDIVEDENGIIVHADLPGVSKEALSIRVDGDTLTVEGEVRLGEPQTIESVYAEVRVARYRRSFVLSRDLDTENVEATMKDGVLKLHLAKREQAKPRRIEVKAA
jgi:HSP20 family molecular chaperone IbpA